MRGAIVVAVLFALGGGVVRADSEQARKERAKALFDAGAARYDVGKWEQAVDYFTKSYDEWPYPETLFGLCQAERQLKNFEKAVFFCKAYLRNQPDAENRATVEDLVREMEKTIDQQNAARERPPEGVQVVQQGATPANTTVRLETRHRQWYEDKWGWGVTSAGLVAAGIGGGFFISASDLRGQIPGAATEFDRQQLRSKAADHDTIGIALTIGGGVVLGLGVGLLIWNPQPHHTHAAVAASGGSAWALIEGEW